MWIAINAAGCGHLLKGSGYRHGQTLEGELDDALKVVADLHRHGLDVLLSHSKIPAVRLEGDQLVEVPGPGVKVSVVAINWLERA